MIEPPSASFRMCVQICWCGLRPWMILKQWTLKWLFFCNLLLVTLGILDENCTLTTSWSTFYLIIAACFFCTYVLNGNFKTPDVLLFINSDIRLSIMWGFQIEWVGLPDSTLPMTRRPNDIYQNSKCVYFTKTRTLLGCACLLPEELLRKTKCLWAIWYLNLRHKHTGLLNRVQCRCSYPLWDTVKSVSSKLGVSLICQLQFGVQFWDVILF